MEPAPRPPAGRFATRAVHAAQAPSVREGPVSPPLHPSATWSVDESAQLGALLSDERDGYVYGRYDNPTNSALHAQIAALHGTEAAWSFASGTAAIHATVEALRTAADGPNRVLATERLYGGTYALFERLVDTSGWEVEFADLRDPRVLETRLGDTTVVYAETIANPTTTVTDLRALGEACQAAGAPLVVDNTFASPYLCRPAELGASAAVESATKYLGGHGDVVAGVVAAPRRLVEDIRHVTYETGGSLGPFEAWLVSRGIQTLPLRMARSCASALAVAQELAGDERVAAVHYPGLPGHPDHDLAERQFDGRGHGGVLAVDLETADAAQRFADACRVFSRAASLGATHSLVLHPASTTHRQLDESALRAAGIGPGLVRLSVGIEDVEDLLADIRGALESAYGGS